MQIIQQRKYAYWFSGIITLASVVLIVLWGLRLGIDFKGGTLMEVRFASELYPIPSLVEEELKPLSLQSLTIQPTENYGMLLRYLASNEKANDGVLEKLKKIDPNIQLLRTDFIGGSVSNQIKQHAFSGTLLSIIGIALYIAWAFRRVSYPINSWEYGIGAVIALMHDILITVGVFAVLGHFHRVEVGVPFI
ncbi:MAG: hypothetical protein ABI747_04155, partial [Candidatus Moraniibacteriota bacterium]